MDEVEIIASFQIAGVTFTVTMEPEGLFLEQAGPGVYRKKSIPGAGLPPEMVRQRAVVMADEIKRQIAEGRFG